MSYQPNSPMNPTATLPPIAPPTPPRRRSWLGPLLIVAGLLGAAATYLAQQVNYGKRIENLERAVSGYTTTLTFEKDGEFTLYYEHAGSFRASFDGQEETITIDAPEAAPDFAASLKDEEGGNVALVSDTTDLSYDTGGFKGTAYATAQIDRPGDYSLEIVPSSPTDEFALALGIGRASKPSIALPLTVGLIGVIPGLLLLMLGGRKRSAASAPVAPTMATAPPAMYQPNPYQPVSSPPPPPQPAIPQPTIPGQPGFPGQAPPPPPPAAPLPPPVWGPPQV